MVWNTEGEWFFNVHIVPQVMALTHLHTCLPLQLYRVCSWKSWKSMVRSGNTDSLSKVPDSVLHENNNNEHGLSDWSWELPKLLCWNLPKPLLTCCACVKDRNMQIWSWKCSTCVLKTWSKKQFFWSFRKRTLHLQSGKLNTSLESGHHL